MIKSITAGLLLTTLNIWIVVVRLFTIKDNFINEYDVKSIENKEQNINSYIDIIYWYNYT